MKRIFLVLFLLISTVVYAETYVVEKTDGDLAFVNKIDGSSDSLESIILQLGYSGLPIHKITSSDIPNDKKDSKYWIWKDRKIVVDEEKKAKDVYSRLDVKYVKSMLYGSLPPERIIELAPYVGLLSDLIEYPNLPGVRDLFNVLETEGIISKEEGLLLKGVFKELDIDLDNLPVEE